MRELPDSLPTPAAWWPDESRSRFAIRWLGDHPPSDITAVRLADRHGEPVTLVRFARGSWAVGTLFGLGVGGAIIWWTGERLVESWARASPVSTGLSLVFLAVMTIAVLPATISAISGPGELALSENGVLLRSRLSWTYLPWSAASGIEAQLRHDDGATRRFILVTADPPRSLRAGGLPRPFRRRDALRIDTGHIAINGVLLYHLLRFYSTHPQARAELGTPVSVDRMRRRDFFR